MNDNTETQKGRVTDIVYQLMRMDDDILHTNVVQAVKVIAADFNGSQFDGSPFDHFPDWLKELIEKQGGLFSDGVDTYKQVFGYGVPGSTDYAHWWVKDEYGCKTWAHPGDYIVKSSGKVFVIPGHIFEMVAMLHYTAIEGNSADTLGFDVDPSGKDIVNAAMSWPVEHIEDDED